MIDIKEYQDAWMPRRTAREVMADTHGYSFGNWVKLGYIDIDTNQKVGQGKERKYSLKNCVQISAMKFLVDSGEQAKAASVISLKLANYAEKILVRLDDEFMIDGKSFLDEQVMFWSGDASKMDGLNRLDCYGGLREDYMKIITGSSRGRLPKNKKTGGGRSQLATVHKFIEAGYIIRRALEGYVEVRNERE